MPKTPTPEQLEAARQLLADHAASEAAASRAATRAAIAPFVAAGFGGDGPLNVNLGEAAQIMRANMAALGAIEPTLQNLAFSGAGVLETFNDRIRQMIVQSTDPEPQPEAPAEPSEG